MLFWIEKNGIRDFSWQFAVIFDVIINCMQLAYPGETA